MAGSQIAGDAIIRVRSQSAGAETDARAIGRRAAMNLEAEWNRAAPGLSSGSRAERQREDSIIAQMQQQAMDRHVQRQIMAQREVMQKTDPLAKAMRKQMMLGQVGFMIEDMASVGPTMGWQGMLRAGSNNASMLMMSLGGVKLALAGIGIIAAAQVAPALFKMFDGSEERAQALKARMEELKRSLDGIADAGRRAGEDAVAGRSLRRIGTAQGAHDSMVGADDEIQMLLHQRAAIEQQMAEVDARMRAAHKPGEDPSEEWKELRKQYVDLQAERDKVIARQEQTTRHAFDAQARRETLVPIEDQQIRDDAALDRAQGLAAVGRIDSFEQARDKARELREELARLAQESEHLQQIQAATGINDPHAQQQRLRNELARQNAADQLAATEARIPTLSARRIRDVALEALSGSDDPEAQRMRVQLQAQRERTQIEQLQLPTDATAQLLGLNELTTRRQLADVALRQAARSGPVIPQVGLEHGSIAAAQAAAANSNASETSQMVESLQAIEEDLREAVRALQPL